MKFLAANTADEWRRVLSRFDYDWYHTWDFHEIDSEVQCANPVLLFFENKICRIPMPLLIRAFGDVNDATSVYGYCGVLSQGSIDQASFDAFQQELIKWLQSEKIVAVFSRMHPIYNTVDEYFGEAVEELGQTVSIDLTGGLEDQLGKMRSGHRREIKKLRNAGAVIKSGGSECLREFLQVYYETMDRLNAAESYYFSQAYCRKLLEARDFRCKVYSAFDADGRLMCSGMFMFTDDIAQYHLSGTATDHLKQAPTKLILDQVRIDATERGCKFFHLGGGVGSKADSLFDFKKGFSKTINAFSVMKWVVDEKKYRDLCEKAKEQNPDFEFNDQFFPYYRQVR